ncbi:hypothetical protein LPJ60_005605 [Coemansia sp. RSA 2675]|uniref:Uncharacterized protein n=1 Tax=Coemansia linderi TaxID=2663919 RepID=A0ACC1KES7_9FUNG|nr:hypothetical protein LPJ60_005605 [Coemansia sp. RSA 2675]KAJ2788823.1 hypothetical protein GGI18_002744 [Coemansia linderi]
MSSHVSNRTIADQLRLIRGLRPHESLKTVFDSVSLAVIPVDAWLCAKPHDREGFLFEHAGLANFTYSAPPPVESDYRLSTAVYARDKEYCEIYERETDIIRVFHSFMGSVPIRENNQIAASDVAKFTQAVFELLYDNCAHISALRVNNIRTASHLLPQTRTNERAPLVDMAAAIAATEAHRSIVQRGQALVGGGPGSNNNTRKSKKKKSSKGNAPPGQATAPAPSQVVPNVQRSDAQTATPGSSTGGGGARGSHGGNSQRSPSTGRPNSRGRSSNPQ